MSSQVKKEAVSGLVIMKAKEKQAAAVWKRVRRVVRMVYDSAHAWCFREPVNEVEHQAPNYYTIITDPQDLGTIKDRLDEDEKTQAAVRQDMEALSRAEQQLVQAQEAEIEALEEWDAWYADSNRARIPQPPKPDGLQIAALEAAVRDAEALVSEPRRYHYGSPQEVKAALTTMLDNCAKYNTAMENEVRKSGDALRVVFQNTWSKANLEEDWVKYEALLAAEGTPKRSRSVGAIQRTKSGRPSLSGMVEGEEDERALKRPKKAPARAAVPAHGFRPRTAQDVLSLSEDQVRSLLSQRGRGGEGVALVWRMLKASAWLGAGELWIALPLPGGAAGAAGSKGPQPKVAKVLGGKSSDTKFFFVNCGCQDCQRMGLQASIKSLRDFYMHAADASATHVVASATARESESAAACEDVELTGAAATDNGAAATSSHAAADVLQPLPVDDDDAADHMVWRALRAGKTPSEALKHPFLDYMRVLGIDLGGEALKGLKVWVYQYAETLDSRPPYDLHGKWVCGQVSQWIPETGEHELVFEDDCGPESYFLAASYVHFDDQAPLPGLKPSPRPDIRAACHTLSGTAPAGFAKAAPSALNSGLARGSVLLPGLGPLEEPPPWEDAPESIRQEWQKLQLVPLLPIETLVLLQAQGFNGQATAQLSPELLVRANASAREMYTYHRQQRLTMLRKHRSQTIKQGTQQQLTGQPRSAIDPRQEQAAAQPAADAAPPGQPLHGGRVTSELKQEAPAVQAHVGSGLEGVHESHGVPIKASVSAGADAIMAEQEVTSSPGPVLVRNAGHTAQSRSLSGRARSLDEGMQGGAVQNGTDLPMQEVEAMGAGGTCGIGIAGGGDTASISQGPVHSWVRSADGLAAGGQGTIAHGTSTGGRGGLPVMGSSSGVGGNGALGSGLNMSSGGGLGGEGRGSGSIMDLGNAGGTESQQLMMATAAISKAIQAVGLPKEQARSVRQGVREMTKKGLHGAILTAYAQLQDDDMDLDETRSILEDFADYASQVVPRSSTLAPASGLVTAAAIPPAAAAAPAAPGPPAAVAVAVAQTAVVPEPAATTDLQASTGRQTAAVPSVPQADAQTVTSSSGPQAGKKALVVLPAADSEEGDCYLGSGF